ncbi:MAG: Rrf2 family transcriptional regulator [Oscillospiraceae bacterium]|nr:Rrf2 family transcriptional regulator [Oscillospiraceae bacterium]
MTGEFSLAVHGLIYLSHMDKTISSETLAKNICTNPARVRKVMAKLKKAGLLSAREGADGGYLFEGDPARITLAQVARALQFSFTAPAWRSGGVDMDCLVASGMADIMDQVYSELDAACLSRLETVTLADILRQVFSPPPSNQ